MRPDYSFVLQLRNSLVHKTSKHWNAVWKQLNSQTVWNIYGCVRASQLIFDNANPAHAKLYILNISHTVAAVIATMADQLVTEKRWHDLQEDEDKANNPRIWSLRNWRGRRDGYSNTCTLIKKFHIELQFKETMWNSDKNWMA